MSTASGNAGLEKIPGRTAIDKSSAPTEPQECEVEDGKIDLIPRPSSDPEDPLVCPYSV